MIGANAVLFVASTRQLVEASQEREAVERVALSVRQLWLACQDRR